MRARGNVFTPVILDANGAIDPNKLAASLRSDAIFRRRFMLAINH